MLENWGEPDKLAKKSFSIKLVRENDRVISQTEA